MSATDTTTRAMTCRHCGRRIVDAEGLWVDPEATGDDGVWRETCDAHDTFEADHEPDLAELVGRTVTFRLDSGRAVTLHVDVVSFGSFAAVEGVRLPRCSVKAGQPRTCIPLASVRDWQVES